MGKYAGALLAIASFALAYDQPAAFSHRQHAPLKLKCTQCHSGAEKQERASFPAISECRVCHVSMTERTIPARRVYRVRDFVFFSHAEHAAAKLECSTCHGEVNRQDVIKLERPTTMAACVACHKETKATVDCNACHELGQ